MFFLFHEEAGHEYLELSQENFQHLKARRVKSGEILSLRNFKDGKNYNYEILALSKKSAELKLIESTLLPEEKLSYSLAWAVVESSVIEKTLPSLNELALKKLILVYCDFSQKNISLNLERFRKILIASSQQCGRSSLLELEILQSSDEFLEKYPSSALIDFQGQALEKSKDEVLLIGPEGGFSERERALFSKKFTLKSPYILRSNTALLGVLSKKIL